MKASSIYQMTTPLLKKDPNARQNLENALLRVVLNGDRVMVAFDYTKSESSKKNQAKQGSDFVAIPGVSRDLHMVLIEKVKWAKSGSSLQIQGKDFMRGTGTKPYSIRLFNVSKISSFVVTGVFDKPQQIKSKAA